MAFIRSKTVKGKSYLYRVESYREHGKVRQRVLEYIGRAEPAAKTAPKKKKKKETKIKTNKSKEVKKRAKSRKNFRGAAKK